MEDFFKVALYLYAYDHLSRPLRQASRSLEFTRRAVERLTQAAERLKAAGERISLAGALVSGASAQATGALHSMVEPLFELDSALKMVAVEYKAAGLSAQEMSRALAESQRAALAWSKAHTQTAAEFATAEYAMLSAGLQHRAALEGTRAALAMATATMGEAGEAADLLAAVYNNLGNHMAPVRQEMWRIADILTKTQQTFQIKNLSQLNESFKYGAPAAKQYRISLEQTATVLGMLNTAGLQGSMAGTAFAAMLRNIYRASEKLGFAIARAKDGSLDLVGTLKNLRETLGDLKDLSEEEQMALQQAFGDEGVRAVVLLAAQVKKLEKAYEDVRRARGITRESQRLFETSALAQLQILHNNLAALRIQLSATILPAINSVIQGAVRLANALGRLAEAHPVLTKFGMSFFFVTTGALAVTATVLSLLGGIYMLSGYGLQALARLLQGFLWLRGGVMEAVARLGLFWQAVQARGGLLAALNFQLLRLKYRFLELTAPVRLVALRTWEWIMAQWAGLRAAIAQAGGLRALAAAYLGRLLGAVRGAVAAVWSFNAALLANPLIWVAGAVVALGAALWWLHRRFGLFDGVFKRFSAGLSWIKGKLAEAVSFLKEHWQAVLKVFLFVSPITAPMMALNKLVRFVTGISLFEAGRKILLSLVEGLKSVAEEPVKAVKSVMEKVRGLLPFSPAKWGPLSDLHLTGRRLMETVAAGVEPGALVARVSAALSAVRKVLAEPLEVGLSLGKALAAPALSALTLPVRWVGEPLPALRPVPAAGERGVSLAPGRSRPAFAPVIHLTVNHEVHFHGEGGEPEEIRRALDLSGRDLEDRLYRAILRALERQRRLSFSGEA